MRTCFQKTPLVVYLPFEELSIKLTFIPSATIPNQPAYHCNPKETKELQQQIQELMEKGYVRESLSPCVVPVLLVPKKDGFVISSEGLEVDQEKVKAIQEWP
ncbi:hypothetical protein V6N13_104767 [Hibiscus sabdariffa]